MHNTTTSVLDFISTPNAQSMCLAPITKYELLNTVKQFKSKMSKDWHDISMRLVQSTIDYVHVLLLYIFNSFRSGIFPDLMKLVLEGIYLLHMLYVI